MFDYLVIGAGLAGAVFARIMTDRGYKCLVIDKRDHIGGNVYSKEIEGIEVHQYGPHIFHTDNERVWKFMNRFAEFNHFIGSQAKKRLETATKKYISLPRTTRKVAGTV